MNDITLTTQQLTSGVAFESIFANTLELCYDTVGLKDLMTHVGVPGITDDLAEILHKETSAHIVNDDLIDKFRHTKNHIHSSMSIEYITISKEISDQVFSRTITQLELKEETEIYTELRIDVELPALFPINPWREGWYGVIWQERTI